MTTNEAWTVQRLLNWTHKFFAAKGIASPRLDAEVLLAHLLKRERIYLYVHFDEIVPNEKLTILREMVEKRAKRMPVAYILGHKEFRGLKFKVTESVLIPRPDTEVLIESVLAIFSRNANAIAGNTDYAHATSTDSIPSDNVIKIADVGTGSGAIGLAIINELNNAELTAVDLSPDALAIATENATSLGLMDRATFYLGDLLEPLFKLDTKYHVIVSNPPYIPDKDILTLEKDIKDYEPHLALAGGEDGLAYYRRIIKKAPELLHTGGVLAFEVGINQAKIVAELMTGAGFKDIDIKKDLSHIERVVLGHKA